MPLSLLVVLFFMLFAIILVVIGVGFRFLEAERRKRVSTVLQTSSPDVRSFKSETDLLNDPSEQFKLPVISELPFFKQLEGKLQQAGLDWNPATVLIAMVVSAAIGFYLGLRVNVPLFRELAAVALALLFGLIPYLYVVRCRTKRMAAFEEQFPEALDFLARSMRAGHAFSVSLEMMADESPEPLAIEFRQVFNEQNLGAPIDVALRNLAKRVPLLDVRFFVSAVLLQRETGGNLAEILGKLSHVIRERFQLKGKVKAVSAHGRITALILCVMPIITMLLLSILAPTYLGSMAADYHGKLLIVGAVVGQIMGYLWMKKIVNIKV